MREHYPSLLLVASAEAGRDDAEDVVQSAVATGLRRIQDFEVGSDFRAWMAAIVRNTARNHRRARRRAGELLQRVVRLRIARDEPCTETGRIPGESGESDRLVLEAVNELPDVARACLLLRVVHEHSYAEISEILDLKEAAARSHVHRARARVAECVAHSGGTR